MILIQPKRWNQKPETGIQVNYGHPLASGLVGCFPLNEMGGTKVTNIITNHQYAFQNTPTWVNTFAGPGLNCEGNDTGVFDTAEPILKPTSAASVLWRGYITSTSSANTEYAGVLYNSAVTSPFISYDVGCDGSQKLAGRWNNGGGFNSDPGSNISTFADTREHSFVFALDSARNVQTLYSDNAKTEGGGSFGAGSITYDATAPFIICTAANGGGHNSHATALCVYLWNREITKDQVAWLWQEPYAFFVPKVPRIITFGVTVGVARALAANVQSASEIKATLIANFGFNAFLQSATSISAPILYNNIAFPSTNIESGSEIQSLLSKNVLMSAILESATLIFSNLKNNKVLQANLESASNLLASLSRQLIGGFGALSVELKPDAPTAYFKTYPRPIGYLKNDNDTTGVSDESPQVSPGYDIFP